MLILASGIIFIGIRFIVHPEIGAPGYGIHFEMLMTPFMEKLKAFAIHFRGLFFYHCAGCVCQSGCLVFSMATVVPVFDFLTIPSYNGSSYISHLLIHGITATVMVITSVLLFMELRNKPQINRYEHDNLRDLEF